MKSAVVKRSIVVGGHRTSVSLEDQFWVGLREIARSRGLSLSELVGKIDVEREHANLSSALRLFVLDYYRGRVPESETLTGQPPPEMASRLAAMKAPPQAASRRGR
jgi:predicted DNA-binding ribbon-helix-helix protein